MKRSWLGLLVLLPAMSFSQSDSAVYAILLKGGLSEYTYTVPGGVGGGSSSTQWKMGPTFGMGFQFPASRTVSLLLVLDYSTNPYQTPSGTQLLNDAKASILDLSVSAKYVLSPVYVAGGLGFSHSRRDEVKRRTVINSSRTFLDTVSGEEETTLVLNLVLGLQFKLANHLSILIQGDARFRSYSSFAIEAGFAYEF